ncbi:hypothetical protein [Thermus caldifontis]|uniref:hypothetical protein n=1 Tax=Thermus caldifontis TaxID=1930763 RepID=UPI000DF4969B|nr:hypothetical protein [Thermus caldifontis]
MRLDPAVRKEAEAKLGRPIPEPDDPEFYRLVDEVRLSDPELAEALEKGIQFEQVVPPEEEVRTEVKKRAFLRDLKNRLLMRYDELSGEWVPSRPKQIALGVLALMGLPVLMWGMNNLGGSPSRAPQTQVAAQAPRQTDLPRQGGAAAPGILPNPDGQEADPLPEGQTPVRETPQVQPGAPAEGGQNAPLAGTDAVPPPPTPAATGEVPPPPATYSGGTPQEVAQPSLTAYINTGGAAQALPATPLAAYGRQATQSQEGQAQAGMGITLGTGQVQAPSMGAYQASQPQAQGQVPPVASFVAYKPSPSPSPTPPAPSTPSQGSELRYFQEAMPEVFGQGQSPGTLGSRQGPVPPPPGTPTVGQAQGPGASPSPYSPGARLRGRLAVRLIVPEGEEVPVAVEAEDGAVFLGKAKLAATRRVELSLDQAVIAGRTYPLKATALGQDRAQGLPAQVREEAPSLVADLVRGSLRGLSDYVKARSQQTTVTTTPGGTVIQQGQSVPLEMYLGAAAADLFSVPQGQKAVIRIAEVAEGSPLEVWVLQ